MCELYFTNNTQLSNHSRKPKKLCAFSIAMRPVKICKYVCMYICICMCVCVCVCVCVHVCMCVCVSVYRLFMSCIPSICAAVIIIIMNECVRVCMCVYVYVYVCMYVCDVCMYDVCMHRVARGMV